MTLEKMVDSCVARVLLRQVQIKEQFLRDCGITKDNAHEFEEIFHPFEPPLCMGGRFVIRQKPQGE